MSIRSRIGKAVEAVGRRIAAAPVTERQSFINLQPGESARSVIDRRTSRDKPIGYTVATPKQRQVWELHRAREESRQLSLTSPICDAFQKWAIDHTLGTEPSQLAFSMKPGDRERLRPAVEAVRIAWHRWQSIPIGGGDETAIQLCAQALWNMIIDGDCFIVPYMDAGRWRLRLYEGDALAEQMALFGQRTERILGVERTVSGMPVAYYFGITDGSGGVYSYNIPWSPMREQRIPANRVWHIRDRRLGGGRARGNPWMTSVLEDIARLDDVFNAFVRGMGTRASIAAAFEQNPEMAASDTQLVGDPFREQVEQTEAPIGANSERVRKYQRFTDDAGNFLEVDAGWKATNLSTGTPSSQEAMMVAAMDRRVTAAIGVSPSTLLGDYAGISFSAGQLLRQQEASTIRRMQAIVRRQLLSRMYFQFFNARWSGWLMEFPRLMPEDREVLADPKHVLPRYQVLDSARTLTPVLGAFNGGLIDLIEARELVGYATPDPEQYIADAIQYREALMVKPDPPPMAGGDGDDDGEDDGEQGQDDEGEGDDAD